MLGLYVLAAIIYGIVLITGGVHQSIAPSGGSSMRIYAIRMVLLCGVLALLGGCEKLWLDRQMKQLCAKDGGVKVYETVKLPPEMFDQHGIPFPERRRGNAKERFGPEFIYERVDQVLDPGDASKAEGILRRLEWRISRRTDGKVLGVAVAYVRTGGDFMTFGHPSGKKCPDGKNERKLITSVFLKGGG